MSSDRHLFTNGNIFTSAGDQPCADAMAVENGRILWIGKQPEMPESLSSCPSVTDLGGRRVIPGFIDAHMHPVMLADMRKQITVMPPAINSIEELVSAVKKRRETQKPGEWISGWGYDEHGLKEQRSPSRYDLDRGCSDSPVYMLRTCAHICCVNSMALKLAGIDRNTPDPPGGEIERGEDGEPTGVLKENARSLVSVLLPPESREQKVQNLLELGGLLTSQGITAICDMGNLDHEDNLPIYEAAAEKGFRQHVGVYYMWDFFADDKDFHIPPELLDRNRSIFAAGLKLIGDGSVSGRTAWMNRPYPGTDGEYGISVCSDNLVESAVSFCRKNHCQLSMHAMGGRAISRMIDRACQEEKWTPEDFSTLAHEGYPGHLYQTVYASAVLEDPIRHILDEGVVLGFSTDAPATFWAVPSDPFPGIKLAVTRTAADGTDCGRDQAVDAETAVRLYTAGAARAAGFPDMGMLVPGYRADFAVLSDDILNIPPEKIDQIRVEETYIGGECVYRRNEK